MRQNSKLRKYIWLILVQPGSKLELPAAAVYLVGLLLGQPLLYASGAVVIAAVCVIRKCRTAPISGYFQVTFPMLPHGWRFVSERRRKRSEIRQKTCRDMTRELVQESCHMADYLAVGKYQAITHDAVVRRLNQDAQIRICSVRPVFSDTLHSILLAQTCKRCRRCAKRCAAWRQAERPFYLVKFEKFDLKGAKKK